MKGQPHTLPGGIQKSSICRRSLSFLGLFGKIFLAIWLVLVAPHNSEATVMGDLAAQMDPGTWAELPTLGMDQGHVFETAVVGKAVTQWAHKAAWDPNTEQFLYLGAPHYNPWKFVIYNAQTNSWRGGQVPAACMTKDPQSDSTACIGHGFDHNTIDPLTGNFYHRQYGSGTIYKYSVAGDSWSTLPPPPRNGYQVAGMVQYFPEMGGVLFGDAYTSPASLFFYNTSTGQWSTLASNLALGPHSHISGYSAVHKVVIFGGGSDAGNRNLYKIDASGTVTQLQNAPFDLRIAWTIFTPDPVSGNFLVVQSNPNTGEKGFYEYDVANDSWKLLSNDIPLFSFGTPVFDIVAAPIDNYGAVMYLKYYFDQTKVYLYKHKQGTGTPIIPDTVAPTIPGGLQGNATSPTEVYLQWQASSDDRAVAGYTIFRNGAQIGNSGAVSFFDSAVPSAGFYQYSVLAFDAAGNQSSPTPAITVEVQGGGSTGSDFAARCNDVNVIRCFSFDSQAETDPHVWAPWRNRTTGVKLGVVDTAVKASGAGSLRFDIPSNVGSDTSGSFNINFSEDLSVQFGEGEDFYIQWRQRFSPEFIDTLYLMDPASAGAFAGGWKQAIVGQGDRPGLPEVGSCTPMELVVQNSDQRGFAQMYHSCGSKDGQYQGLGKQVTSTDWALQFGDVEGCLWSLKWSNTDQPWNKRFTEPYGPCMGYRPNEWMTFQMHVHIGTWYLNDQNYHQDSTVELWAAFEGQPSVKIIDRTGYDLVNCAAGDTACQNDPSIKYGKIWLLPYHSNKGVEQVHPPAATWYDDLIISRAKIADPQISSGDQFPPAPPQNLQISP